MLPLALTRGIVLTSLLVGTAALPSLTSLAQEQQPPGSITFSRGGDIWVWSNGAVRMLIDGNGATDPRWSPDARALLYVAPGEGFSDLLVRDLTSGQEVRLTHNEAAFAPGSREYVDNSVWVQDPAWSPSGAIAYASDDLTTNGRMALWLLPDVESDPMLAPEAIEGGSVEGISISTDGTWVAYTERNVDLSGGPTAVVIRDLIVGTSTVLAEDDGGAFGPAIAPDDTRLALSIRGQDGITDLWLINRQSGQRLRLTSGANAVGAVWSPDGRWLAYLSPEADGFALWVLPVRESSRPATPVKIGTFDDLDTTGGLSWTLEPVPGVI